MSYVRALKQWNRLQKKTWQFSFFKIFRVWLEKTLRKWTYYLLVNSAFTTKLEYRPLSIPPSLKFSYYFLPVDTPLTSAFFIWLCYSAESLTCSNSAFYPKLKSSSTNTRSPKYSSDHQLSRCWTDSNSWILQSEDSNQCCIVEWILAM